jgi:hypothetical protein
VVPRVRELIGAVLDEHDGEIVQVLRRGATNPRTVPSCTTNVLESGPAASAAVSVTARRRPLLDALALDDSGRQE